MTTQRSTVVQNSRFSRRDVLVGAIAFVGGAAGLAGCGREEIDDLDLHSGARAYFGADQMRLLGRVVDIVIPETDTPGALAAGVHVFIDGMMAGWASAGTREYYSSVLAGIDAAARSAHGTGFVDCDEQQQFRLLSGIDADAYGPNPAFAGFRDLKFLVFAGYYTSEVGATVELQYDLVPGQYVECEPIGDIGRAWTFSR